MLNISLLAFLAANKRRVYVKSQLKRQYARTLRAEGLAPVSVQDASESRNEIPSEPARQKRHKPDPFKRAKAEAAAREQALEQKSRDKALAQEQKELRLKERENRRAILSKRTAKGQPVMAGRIGLMLERIKRDTT